MWFSIVTLIISVISLGVDFILYRFFRYSHPLLAKIIGIIGLLSFLYLLVFMMLFLFRAGNFHSLKWGIFVFLLLTIPHLIFFAYWLIAVFPLTFFPVIHRISMYIGLGIELFLFLSILYGSFIGNSIIRTKHVVIESERIPLGFDGFRIVQISDFHLGTFGNKTGFVQRVVKTVNAQKPDLVAFTGDLVNNFSSEVEPFIFILSQIKSLYGVYSILGNHDYGDYHSWENEKEKTDNFERLLNIQKEMGWLLLNDENRHIHKGNDSIVIMGVQNWGDPPFKRYGDLRKAYKQVDTNSFVVLLSHNPVHWREEVLPQTNIDLMLAGHTHAAQMRIGNLSPARLRYAEWAGLYKEGNKYLYVNQGLGSVFFPLRIWAHPEITVIELKSIVQ
ncbi:MAG: metallophosphoesterase [Bacteroidales bacterium]|jgi:predicted MPP superfamily phosphohydrolase|nr:metallophosphoesterase [Bacteroidales bacterium]